MVEQVSQLDPLWSQMGSLFHGGMVFWGLILCIDVGVAIYRYFKSSH